MNLHSNNPKSYLEFESRHLPYLKKLANHKKTKKIRVIGTIAAFELDVEESKGYLNSAGKLLKKLAIEKGVFIRPLGNVIYLLPPLSITNKELEKCYSVIEDCLSRI